MPQPVNQAGARPHKLMLDRPDLAARIAAIAAQWTQVEISMAELLAAAFGSSELTEDGAHMIARNWIALTAIREVSNIRGRMDIMDATLGAVLDQNNSTLLPEWTALKDDLFKRGRERNDVVHGDWSISDQYPDDLILEERKGRCLLYTAQDLDNILDRIVAVWQRCEAFKLSILNAKLAGELPI